MDSHIISKLKTKESFELHILSEYQDILDRTTQIIHNIDNVNIRWERIHRLSLESNFIMVVGETNLPKGLTVNGSQLKNETLFVVSLILPWMMLDDGTTAFELAEICRTLSTIPEIIGADRFFEMLKNKKTTMDTLKAYMPKDVESSEPTFENPSVPQSDTGALEVKQLVDMKNYPNFLSSFKLDELTDEQRESLMLTLAARKMSKQ